MIRKITEEDYTIPNIQLLIIDKLKSYGIPLEEATEDSHIVTTNLSFK